MRKNQKCDNHEGSSCGRKVVKLVILVLALYAAFFVYKKVRSTSFSDSAELTPPERALEKILQINKSDENLFRVITKNPNNIHLPKETEKYHDLFSKELISEFARKEEEAVHKNCGKKYKYDEGTVCGIDYDPLICAQVHPRGLTYKTIEQTEHLAIIECDEYSSSSKQTIKYRMIKHGENWILDAVSCPVPGDEFNWHKK